MTELITRQVPARHRRLHHPQPLAAGRRDCASEAHRALVMALDTIGMPRSSIGKVLRVSGPFLAQLVRGTGSVPPTLCEPLWRLSGVTPERLRPDLQWAQDDDGLWYWRVRDRDAARRGEE